MKINVGIVGLGFVGEATLKGLEPFHNIHSYDISKESSCNSIKSLVNRAQMIFVCVPTPMKKSGKFDLSIVRNVINDINSHASERKIIILKSTCLPGTSSSLQNDFDNCDIVFNPEFLTEKNYINDFKNQEFIVLGGNSDTCNSVKEMYMEGFPDIKYFLTNTTTAETVKYTINNFLALKVSFANEIYELCSKMGIDYKTMISIASADNRLGQSHWSVPGHDGKFGYGGSCFPKDVSALYNFMNSIELNSFIVKAALERNIQVDRKERDWEALKGRAISDES
jgi:UDPglucose 6-dehydrogenase